MKPEKKWLQKSVIRRKRRTDEMYSEEKMKQLPELEKIGKMAMTDIMEVSGLKKSGVYEIRDRFRNNERLNIPKGCRKKRFGVGQEEIIRTTYRELEFRHGDEVLPPSMKVLKNIVESENFDFPEASLETYRKIVLDMECYPKEQKPARRYRKRFEAPAVGMLIQGDVTTHNWIENAEPFSLPRFVDDHSRKVLYARFIESDNLRSHFEALEELFTTYGIPWKIYYDNDAKYRKKICGNPVNPSVVQACNELGIEVINSTPYVPQGKGKIERKFQTFQKRLIFYMKRGKVRSWEEAQAALAEYVELHNNTVTRAFGDTPENRFKTSDDVFIEVKRSDLFGIENALTIREVREVREVNEISYKGAQYRIPMLGKRVLAGRKVEVRERIGEWIRIFYQGRVIAGFKLDRKSEGKNGSDAA